MADISKELEVWRTARYGREVRQAQIDLSNKLNQEVEAGTKVIKNYEAAEAARVAAENQRVKNENARAAAETARAKAETARQQAEEKRQDDFATSQKASEAAAKKAEDIAAEVEEKLENGDFIGPQGPQGEQGPQGNPGIVTQLNPGMIAFGVEGGHLMMYHNDNDPQPPMSIGEDGHLYYTF